MTCWCGQPAAPGSDRCDGHHWLERVAFRQAGEEAEPAGEAADGDVPGR
jgi:hypothetical protein